MYPVSELEAPSGESVSKQAATSIAAAVFLVVVAATSAIALNLGLLQGVSSDDQVAAETTPATSEEAAAAADPAATTPATTLMPGLSLFPNGVEVVTVYVDEPVAATPAAAPPAAAPQSASPAAASPTPTPAPTAAPAAPTQPPATPAPTLPPTTTTAPATTTTAPPQTSTSTTAAPTTTTTTAAQWEYPSFTLPGIGDVILQKGDGEIRYYGAYPINGWKFIVEDEGPGEVKVKFALLVDGEVEDEAEFKAELKNGRIVTEMES